VPTDGVVLFGLQTSRLVSRTSQLRQVSELRTRHGLTVHAGQEDLVEKITSPTSALQLGIGVDADLHRHPEDAIALAPQAQVGGGDEGISGRRVTPLLGSVDEVEGGVARHEWHLGNRLHRLILPAKSCLLVRCAGEGYFAGAPRLVSGVEMTETILVLVSALAAIGWGASDYFGGDASRGDTPVFVVVAIAEGLGVVVLVPVLVARGAPLPDSPRMLLAALAGLAVTCELGLIYRAISRGDAFITAPIGALGAASAVSAGLIGGDPFGVSVAVGLLFALVGGGVSAWTSHTTRRPGGSVWKTAATCVGAAAAVGTMLTCLHAAGRGDPYWATAIEHTSTATSAGILAVVGSRGLLRHHLPRRSEMPRLALVAVVGVAGDLAYATASHGGALSVVSAVSSLYPVATIALGRLLQSHRATRPQLAGIVLALAGAALLGATSH